jgi:uncharacterized protein
MIHPDTRLQFINDKKGRGIVATRHIPKGTVTYVRDKLEIVIAPGDPLLEDPGYKNIIETYTYTDPDGTRILSWDHAKYVNHCCQCNTISTGYGFEIAIRDIEPQEEITDEYGLFNIIKPIELECEFTHCRKMVSGQDIDKYYRQWDEQVIDALKYFNRVDQPLAPYIESGVKQSLDEYLEQGTNYRSVLELKYPGR